VKGWVRTRRDAKGFSFLEINDGSSITNLQVIAAEAMPGYDIVQRITTGCSVAVAGALTESEYKMKKWDILSRHD